MVSAHERSVATGIFNTGSNMGAIFAPVLVPFIVAAFGGWQAAFITLGCADLVWLAFWLGFFGDPPEKSKRVGAGGTGAHPGSGCHPGVGGKNFTGSNCCAIAKPGPISGTRVLRGRFCPVVSMASRLPDFFNKQFSTSI